MKTDLVEGKKIFKNWFEELEKIREKIPNSIIFIVECSELNEEYNSFLLNNSDFFLNLYNIDFIRENINSISKSLGEGTMTFFALNKILEINIDFDNLIKISGRYWLSNNFNYKKFDNNNIIIKYINNDMNNVFTALYKIPYKNVLEYKNFLENNFHLMKKCIGYENLFSIFINSQNTTINHINNIGLEGYISISNDFYSG
jgi:hypothetical protein